MIELSQLAPATRFILQGGAAARAAAGEAFGVPLPESACRANARDGRAALWLGPDEHLLLGPADERDMLAAELESALAGLAHSLVDVSHRQVAWLLSGAHASELFNTGCPLDLDVSEFPPGMCTRTLLGKAEIVVWRTGAEAFHLEVWRSFADYVLAWLREAERLNFGGDT
ncbi:MAG TPA: sarcosine oxidase subunit gamma family protein [Steroidobacteraceae bacterium]|nr:sarcosine oxidase subunit gamma family protein [Steroidobacteraceae bacterium]